MELSTEFQKIGLNKYQSNALAVIHNDREATALNVSEKGQIPYTKVYEILVGLEQRGFIMSSLERPKKYRITDVNKIIDTMIEHQKKQYFEAKRQARSVEKALACA